MVLKLGHGPKKAGCLPAPSLVAKLNLKKRMLACIIEPKGITMTGIPSHDRLPYSLHIETKRYVPRERH